MLLLSAMPLPFSTELVYDVAFYANLSFSWRGQEFNILIKCFVTVIKSKNN